MGAVLLCGLVLAAHAIFDFSMATTAGIITAILLGATLIHAWRSLRGPNADREANLRRLVPTPQVWNVKVEQPGGEFKLPEHEQRFRKRSRYVWVGMLAGVGLAVVPIALPAAFWPATIIAVIVFFWFARDLYFIQWAIAEECPKVTVFDSESELVDAGTPYPERWRKL
jgi:hypothetical protein